MAMQLLSQAKNNVAVLERRRQLGVSYPTAWLLKHKIMEAMRRAESEGRLHGRVELDDAYLGGKRSGRKSGRSSENKVPFVLAVQTTDDGRTHQVCAAQLPFRRSAVAEFCDAHLLRPLTVVSDGLDCFTAAARSRLRQRIVTGGGKASVRRPEFASVNILLGNLKIAITGTYHAVDFAKYSCRYLAEYRFRFNRRYRMREMLPRLLRAVACATALSTALARAPEDAC